MRLEADDGRPEASPPLRRGVQTADRAVVRERQAIPGDQGRVRHRAIDPAALGPRHPQQRLHRAADNRTPERNEPIEPGKRNRQLEMKVDVSEQAAPVFARRQARYGPTPAAARYQRSAGSRALPSRPTTGCSDTPRPSASTLMRRTWSACSATAAGCTEPGGSSTPWGMRAWRSPGAASTGS